MEPELLFSFTNLDQDCMCYGCGCLVFRVSDLQLVLWLHTQLPIWWFLPKG